MNNEAFHPDWFSKPGDSLASLMTRNEVSPKVLAERIGCDELTIRNLLIGAERIDEEIASRLANSIGGTQSFWKRRQDAYDSALARAASALTERQRTEWLRQFPSNELIQHGWLGKSERKEDLLKTYLVYFGVNSPEEWKSRYADFQSDVALRASPVYESKIGALTAWLRQAEIKATFLDCKPWDINKFQKSLRNIRVLTKAKAPSYFLPRLQSACAESGVAVVFVRAPAGCRASGAARFISSNKALIVLSFRYLSDDHFWFTFFHEAGHLILHSRSSTFIDSEESNGDKSEVEANTFSASVLIPQDRREELLKLRPRRENVIRFAISVGTSPGVVVGQMQHYGIVGHGQLNHLKRRYTWEQIGQIIS